LTNRSRAKILRKNRENLRAMLLFVEGSYLFSE